MDPLAELFACCRRWQELTDAEGQAIEAEDWPAVTAHQHEKTRLQEQVEESTTRIPETERRRNSMLTTIFGNLVQQEERNAERLRRKLACCRSQREETERSGHNLRRLRGAYGSVRNTTWHSYS